MTYFKKSLELHKWLENIIHDNIAKDLNLAVIDDSCYALFLPGQESKLVFPIMDALWSTGKTDMPCARWEPAGEGWQMGEKDLVMPGMATDTIPLIKIESQDYRVNYDILGLIFWMFSRAEEVGRDDLDIHGRFPARSSHAWHHDYLERPIIDEWFSLIRNLATRLWPSLKMDEQDFAVKVSHDVDQPLYYKFRSFPKLMRVLLIDLVKRKDITYNLKLLSSNYSEFKEMDPSDPFNTFSWLMDVSERNGLQSAFYFQSGKTDYIKDADYDLNHPAIRKLMSSIHSRGHEIGLHPGYNTYRNPDIARKQLDKLKQACSEEGFTQSEWGGRMHYLRCEIPTTLHVLSEAGLSYDSTLGYADHAGFRCGTCHEYPAFNPVTWKRIPIRIRPLIVMERTIADKAYMNLGSGEEGFNRVMYYKDACRKYRGNFTILWHNSFFIQPEWRDFYQNILKQ